MKSEYSLARSNSRADSTLWSARLFASVPFPLSSCLFLRSTARVRTLITENHGGRDSVKRTGTTVLRRVTHPPLLSSRGPSILVDRHSSVVRAIARNYTEIDTSAPRSAICASEGEIEERKGRCTHRGVIRSENNFRGRNKGRFFSRARVSASLGSLSILESKARRIEACLERTRREDEGSDSRSRTGHRARSRRADRFAMKSLITDR